MKTLCLFLGLFLALALASSNPEKRFDSQKVAELVTAESTILHTLVQAQQHIGANFKAIFNSHTRKRQSEDCDSDSENRDLESCDGCSIIGIFQNVTEVEGELSFQDTDGGIVRLITTLGVEFEDDWDYDIVGEARIRVDEAAAAILNEGQQEVCETDYDDIDFFDDVVRYRVTIDGAYDTRSECEIDSCEFYCTVVETFSQTICGAPIDIPDFVEFVEELVDELGVNFDSDVIPDQDDEDSNFVSELLYFGQNDPCNEIEDDYPARFGINFGEDTDDNNCNILYFDDLPDIPMPRRSAGGKVVAGLFLVVMSVVVSLFGM